MADRYAVVWTRSAAGPVKMGNLVATGRECRFSYTDEFLQRRPAPALSLLAGPELFGSEPVVYRSSARMPLHPRLMSLVPADSPGNLQRRIHTELLARRSPPPAPGFETEWELLLLTGHGGIGHIDVFGDDIEAEDWYANPVHPQSVVGRRSAVWRFVREEIEQSGHAVPADTVAELLGPTPSVGGMIPKLLATIVDAPAWDGRFAPPGTPAIDDRPAVEVILKIEPAPYAGLAELEALCLDLHRELGFEVPRYWRADVDGMPLLAVERFDRTADGLPLPLESFLSVMAAGSRAVRGSADAEWSSVGRMLERLGRVASLDVKRARREVYRRFVLAFLTGNGDLHLENLSFLGGADAVRVAPVYDPSPMRAWPRHDLRSALPVDFDSALSLAENLYALGAHFGLRRDEAADLWSELRRRSEDYPERIMALEQVPLARRRTLADLVRRERALVS